MNMLEEKTLITVGAITLVAVGAAWLIKKTASTVTDAAGAAAQAVNPLNHDNVFASAVNAVGGAVVSDTGPGKNADGSWTLGGWFYDVTHPGVVDQINGINGPIAPANNPR